MNSSFIRKVEKAKDYALQKERVNVTDCTVRFQGENGDHTITYEAGRWHCDCDYHIGRDTCTHIMALQIMLGDIVHSAPAPF